MHDATQIINSATDVKIFIEYNKSTNPIVGQEQFQDFQSSTESPVPQKPQQPQQPASTFVVFENYMHEGSLRTEESKK